MNTSLSDRVKPCGPRRDVGKPIVLASAETNESANDMDGKEQRTCDDGVTISIEAMEQ